MARYYTMLAADKAEQHRRRQSEWVITVVKIDKVTFKPWIYNRRRPSLQFTIGPFYTRRDSAIRGARRLAKALGINADIDRSG